MNHNSSVSQDKEFQLFSSILESSYAGIVTCDIEGTITFANRRINEIRGRDIPVGTKVSDWLADHQLFYPESNEKVKNEDVPILRALFKHEIVRGFEVQIKKPNNDVAIVSISANPLYDKGVVNGAMISLVEITKTYKQKEELSAQNKRLKESVIERTTILQDMNIALGRSQTRFKTIVEQSPFGIQIFNSKGKTILVNPAWKKIFDFSDEYIHDFILQKYNILEDQSLKSSGVSELVQKAFKGDTVKIPEIHYSSIGAGKWIESILYPLKHYDGSVREIVLIHNDVSERHTVREQKERFIQTQNFLANVTDLLLSSIDFKTIIDQVANAAIPFFADGAFVDLIEGNKIKRIIARHSHSEKEAYMREMQTSFPPTIDSPQPTPRVIRSGIPELLKDVDSEIIAERTFDEKHADLIRKIGIKSHIAVPLINRGEIIGALNFLITTGRRHFDDQDLTISIELARRAALAINNARLYRDAQNAIQLRDDFISIASHELKTPITAIKLQQEVIGRSLEGEEIKREDADFAATAAQNANRQLDRLTRLVEDMLDISRISTGKLAMNLQTVDFAKILGEVLERFHHQLNRLRIDLKVIGMKSVMITCDPYRMEQVITNLMTNAIRYGERKPITISLSTDNSNLSLEIKDQGIGIAKEDQERIFNRFERAMSFDGTSGLGLGLYISREIMKDHNGSLFVESEPGLGSKFTIKLGLD